MKIKMIRTLSPLFVGLSIASSAVSAGELGSFASEVTLNDYKNGYQKIEATIGVGSYKLNDDFKFLFDVDKDFIKSNVSEEYVNEIRDPITNAVMTPATTIPEHTVEKEGWDTQFGLSQNIGSFADIDATMYYLVRYDASWEASNGDGSSYTAQYILAPVFDTDFTIANQDFSLSLELWVQVGESDGGSLQDVSGYETNFYLNTDLSESWSLSLAWYNFNYYNSSSDEYDYQMGTEDYLTYSLPLNDNVTFSLEGYYEAYYTPESKDRVIYGHIKPMITYKKKIDEDLSWHADISYGAVSYEHHGSESTWSNNEVEVAVGFSL